MANADTPTKITDDMRPAKTEQSDMQLELTYSLTGALNELTKTSQ